MVRTTFNRLRAVKDSLPHGSMDAIAAELGVSGDEVRAYFNMSQLDYNAKITIKEARELFKRF